MSTLEQAGKSLKQYVKILWGLGTKGRHMGPSLDGQEKQIP